MDSFRTGNPKEDHKIVPFDCGVLLGTKMSGKKEEQCLQALTFNI